MDEGSLQAAGAELFAKFGATLPFTRKSSSSHNGKVQSPCQLNDCGTSLDKLRARRGLAPDSVDPRGILGLFGWRWLGNSSAVGCHHWISAGVSRLTLCRQCVLVVCRCAKVFWRSDTRQVDEVAVAHMQNWYKSHNVSSKWQGKLTVDRVRTSGGWHKLKAKAACTRHLAQHVLHLAQTFGTSEDRRVSAVCQLLCEFYGIVSSESMFVTASAKEKSPKIGRNLAIIYSALAEQTLASHTRMWKMHPKLHLFVHMCEWQAVEVGNPRFYWTYSDEDLVGLPVEVAQSCHSKTLAASALLKWMHVNYMSDICFGGNLKKNLHARTDDMHRFNP